jgi:hypothetical protein
MDKQDLIAPNFLEAKAIEQIAQAVRELTAEIKEMRSELKKVLNRQSQKN